eukprot:2412973-Pleurochrysis_carterae.AAC.1
MRAVSWSRDICPVLYCQQLGLDCNRPLCVILHTNVEQMLQNRTIISMQSVFFPSAYLMLNLLSF